DRIEELLGRPSQIELTPHAHPALARLLGERGYRIIEWHQMLARPLETAFPEGPSGVQVSRLRPEDESAWAGLVSASFQATDEPPAADARLVLATTRAEGAACFIARVDGQPAGGASAFVAPSRHAVLAGAGV